MPPSRPDQSHRSSTPQNRGQVLWTGAVALILGVVALQQSTDPGPSPQLLTPDSLASGSPALSLLNASDSLDGGFGVAFEGAFGGAPWDQAITRPLPTVPPTAAPAAAPARSVAGIRPPKRLGPTAK